MALFQGLAVGPLSGRVSEMAQLAVGFSLMGVGIALISKRSGSQTGSALGLQNSANNLGQVIGPLLGGTMFAWQATSPYLMTSITLLSIGTLIGLRSHSRLNAASLAA